MIVIKVYTSAVLQNIGKYPPAFQTPLHRSIGSFVAIRTSTTGTCFSSLRIEVILGNVPSWWMMTTRCNHAEAVFLRSEANWTNSPMNSSVRTQSKNASVFREGEAEGFENRAGRCGNLVSRSMVNVSRAGKDDR